MTKFVFINISDYKEISVFATVTKSERDAVRFNDQVQTMWDKYPRTAPAETIRKHNKTVHSRGSLTNFIRMRVLQDHRQQIGASLSHIW
jgi:hypothetical protein